MAEDFHSMPDSYWREKLSPEAYRVLREKGTEAPQAGEFVNSSDAGIYSCAACGQELFSSETKFESRLPGLVGWPAFYAELSKGNVELKADDSMGMRRTEITCARCGSHLGHLFEGDPDAKTGQHYCVNSVALAFKPEGAAQD